MNKLYILILLLLTLLIINKPVLGIETFIKYSNNPLKLDLGTKYTSLLQTNELLINGKYYSVMSVQNLNNKYALVLAESTDGLSWKVTKSLLESSYNLYAPRLLAENSTQLKLFYTKEQSNLKIYYVSCDTDFNCSSSETLVLTPSANNWDSDTVASGYPYYLNGNYYLFYEGLSSGVWNIGMAYSTDGINWTKCSNPIISNGGGSFLFNMNSNIYLVFHNANTDESKHGVEIVGPTKTLSCDTSWDNRHYLVQGGNIYDKTHITAPSIIFNENNLFLYYTGTGSDIRSLNLATATVDPTDTPTPTPTPTLVPTNTPTPTPSHSSIVIIPGFLSSWNKEAILHNQIVNQSDWKMNPYVHEYDGIMQTLKNIGYEENKNLYIFPYDWRQRIDKSSEELNNFISNKVNGNVSIIGHSLGGLVGRLYTQKHSDKVDKLITVGTPHAGAVQSYKALEGGEVDKDNSWLWLAEKSILMLNKNSLEPDRITVQQKFPVLYDLLPTYEYLKTSQNTWIKPEIMKYKNPALPIYNDHVNEIATITNLSIGIGHSSPSGFIVNPVEGIDKILGNYPDGYPSRTLFEIGDGLIPKKSALINSNFQNKDIDLNHWQLIADKKGVQAVMQFLNIQVQDKDLAAGKLSNIAPSLIFLIKSPATMTVTDPNNQTITENDGMIFIENPVNGTYSLQVTGTNYGSYTVLIGKNGTNNDVWQSISGEITQNPPSTQIDTYPLTITMSDNSLPLNSANILLTELIQYLKKINKDLKNNEIEKSITHLQKIKDTHKNKNDFNVKMNLIAANSELLKAYKQSKNDDKVLAAIEKLENVYPILLKSYKSSVVKHLLTKLNIEAKKELKEEEKILHKRDDNSKNILILKQIDNRIKQIERDLDNNNLLHVEILLQTIHRLLKL